MRIEVKGRNVPVSDDIREHVVKRFRKVSRQVSELAELEVELSEERNPAIAESQVAEATLYLKGVTLRARDASREMLHSINLCADELARPGQAPSRQAPQAPRGAGGRCRRRRWTRRRRSTPLPGDVSPAA